MTTESAFWHHARLVDTQAQVGHQRVVAVSTYS